MSSLTQERLNALTRGMLHPSEYAVAHEIALLAWGLDNNLVPYGVDLLVSKKAFARMREAMDLREDLHQGNPFVRLDNEYAPVRLWQSVGENVTFDRRVLIEVPHLECQSLRPEIVLEALPTSPDFALLLEQRAALAEVLFFDDMTDDQLMEFRRFVRVI